ncbi:MAG: iron-containing alcohol dehydrogenase [Chitinivibrionales bacterium]|nr:iron-containing alcohol dehydrogenase [Chitinivibrionales bacterium]
MNIAEKPEVMKQPSSVEFGYKSCSHIPRYLAESTRIFIVCDPALVHSAAKIGKSLASETECTIYSHVEPEPKISTFEKILLEAKTYRPDAVVGIGGGSTIDLAKLLAVLCNSDKSFSDIVGTDKIYEKRTIRLMAVPTTSGTGSEVSPIAILTDSDQQLKIGAVSDELIPDVAVVDPELMLSMPPSVTAETGMDAMTHCIEAYTNRFSTSKTDVVALEGITLIGGNLLKAYRNGNDLAARTAVARGALCGGLCLGSVNTAAVHALAYPLGGEFCVSHGKANSMLLPYIMEYNLSECVEKYANIGKVLGCKEKNNQKRAQQAIVMIRNLAQACGIPTGLKELGVPQTALEHMATSALKVTRLILNNPRSLEYDDVLDIYSKAYCCTRGA